MPTKFSTSAKLHSRRTKGGHRPIYVLYTYNKATSTFPTSLTIHEDDWDNKKKLATVGSPESVSINTTIQQMQADLLGIASALPDPHHELVKRRFLQLASDRSTADRKRKAGLAYHIAELADVEEAEQRLTVEKASLKQRKTALAPALPDLAKIGVLTQEAAAVAPGVQELYDLFLAYAGTGEPIPNQKDAKGKPKRDQGSLKHYKPDTYKHVRSMWQQLNEFSRVKEYPLTVQTINQEFYQKFGDYILFNLDNYDNHFGSLIKRLKTFLLWCESERGVAIHPQVKSRKFKVFTEENEIIILSDDDYQRLAEFRSEPECRPAWVKYIDMTLFQSAMGLRHSDMRRASWRVEGSIVDGKDKRVIKGTTQKNKSTYIVPVHLNPEWTIGILEKYQYDFNETARSSKQTKQTQMVTEQKLNQNMKVILQAVSEKYGILKTVFEIRKRKWGAEYTLGRKHQWELHSSHDNRRAFITRLYRAGNNEKLIARMVGTKSLPELRKYQQLNEDDVIGAMNKKS